MYKPFLLFGCLRNTFLLCTVWPLTLHSAFGTPGPPASPDPGKDGNLLKNVTPGLKTTFSHIRKSPGGTTLPSEEWSSSSARSVVSVRVVVAWHGYKTSDCADSSWHCANISVRVDMWWHVLITSVWDDSWHVSNTTVWEDMWLVLNKSVRVDLWHCSSNTSVCVDASRWSENSVCVEHSTESVFVCVPMSRVSAVDRARCSSAVSETSTPVVMVTDCSFEWLDRTAVTEIPALFVYNHQTFYNENERRWFVVM